MAKITAYHINGYVKFAAVRPDSEVAAFVATLESRGYWTKITVEPFNPARPKARRGHDYHTR